MKNSEANHLSHYVPAVIDAVPVKPNATVENRAETVLPGI